MLVSQHQSTTPQHPSQSVKNNQRALQHNRFRPRSIARDDALVQAHFPDPPSPSNLAPSAQSILSLSPAISDLDSDSASVLSQLETANSLFDFSPLDNTGSALMPELWSPDSLPRSLSRPGHNRDASLSSLGSVAGPLSPPYSRAAVNPRIAVNDSSLDEFESLHAGTDAIGQHHYPLKPYGQSADMLYANMPVYSAPANNHSDQSASLMPPSGQAASSSTRRPRPVSVASSIMSDSSPATPSAGDPDDNNPHPGGHSNDILKENPTRDLGSLYYPATTMSTHAIPKLARTVTDAYGDELFNPNFHLTSSKDHPSTKVEPSQASDIFAQAIHAANTHNFDMHPMQFHGSRGRSPFRQGAPLAPAQSASMGASRSGGPTAGTQASEYSPKPPSDSARSVNTNYGIARSGEQASEPNTPHTISPKDTFLDFHTTDGDDDFALFAPSSGPFHADMTKPQQQVRNDAILPAGQPTQHGTSNFSYYPSGVRFEVQSRLPQQYPFVRQPRMQQFEVPNGLGPLGPNRGNMPIVDARNQSQGVGMAASSKPANSSADGGTYTCTYHGCSLRFETPVLLQKHKREGHRQAHGLNNTGRRLDPSQSTGLFNTQSGPHKCDRINPTTGKPCNAIFSRPYDLTRHEDTIHNIRKVKVRCELCTEEKTFSRADALTRHFRVCHPGVEIPAKHRRRGGH